MERPLARKFLYLVAAIILIVLGFGVAYQLNPGWFGRVAFVPSAEFEPQEAIAPNAYDEAGMWLARPGMEDNPSDWRPVVADAPAPPPDSAAAQSRDQLIPPANAAERLLATSAVKKGDAAVFFVHPTSYYSKSSWNPPPDRQDANYRAGLFMRGKIGRAHV